MGHSVGERSQYPSDQDQLAFPTGNMKHNKTRQPKSSPEWKKKYYTSDILDSFKVNIKIMKYIEILGNILNISLKFNKEK